MRELLEIGKQIMIVPTDFKKVNKGKITDISPDGFTIDLDYEPEGILRHNYCEFYTQNQNGTLFFTSFPQEIDGKTLKIANPIKHRYLQRRQYTRVKYGKRARITTLNTSNIVKVLDISAGGMKFTSSLAFSIVSKFWVTLPLAGLISVKCKFLPVRIEKGADGYTVSGRFVFALNRGQDKARIRLAQYCAQKSLELRNK